MKPKDRTRTVVGPTFISSKLSCEYMLPPRGAAAAFLLIYVTNGSWFVACHTILLAGLNKIPMSDDGTTYFALHFKRIQSLSTSQMYFLDQRMVESLSE
jgi:hypothetical protein